MTIKNENRARAILHAAPDEDGVDLACDVRLTVAELARALDAAEARGWARGWDCGVADLAEDVGDNPGESAKKRAERLRAVPVTPPSASVARTSVDAAFLARVAASTAHLGEAPPAGRPPGDATRRTDEATSSIAMTPEARASCEAVAAPVKNWPAWKKAGVVDVPQTGIVDRVAFAQGDRVQTPGGPATVIYGIASAVNSARNGSYAVRLDNANPASPARSIYPVASLSRPGAKPARDYEADLLAVADALGFVNRAEGIEGYEIAPMETIVGAIHEMKRDESRLYDEEFRAGMQAAEEQIARWHEALASLAEKGRAAYWEESVDYADLAGEARAHRESADAIRAGKHREGK